TPPCARPASLRPPRVSPSARDHPCLHSYPTRRSSDLNLAVPHQVLGARELVGEHRSHQVLRVHALERRGHLLAAARAQHGERPGDRKSTRLNSSHVSISYAVFCLKKKN